MCTSDGCESLIYFTGLFSNHYRTFNFWFASLYFVDIGPVIYDFIPKLNNNKLRPLESGGLVFGS
jgi:hypothetical protein